MKNKYQEALNIVNERFDYMNEELHPNKHYQKPQFSLDTLQQLIDNYSKLEKALDKICKLLARLPDGCSSPSKCIDDCEKCWKEWALESEDTE